jgi:hypothetical protein
MWTFVAEGFLTVDTSSTRLLMADISGTRLRIHNSATWLSESGHVVHEASRLWTWAVCFMILEEFQQGTEEGDDLPVVLGFPIDYSVHILPVVVESCCGICFTHKGS